MTNETNKEKSEIRYSRKQYLNDYKRPNITFEHDAWTDLFQEIRKVFNLSSEELNSQKYRRMFELIERWAYYDRLRRKENPESEEFKGILWDGKE